MIRPVRVYGDPVLRRRARPVTDFDQDLRALVADMIETMIDADGLGLAAPQIGVSKRVFVVAGAAEAEPTRTEPDASATETGAGDLPTEAGGDGVATDASSAGAEDDGDRASATPAGQVATPAGQVGGPPSDDSPEEQRRRALVFVNPSFEAAGGRQVGIEGCLSLPGLYHESIARHAALVVRYQDLEGVWHEREAEGRFAVVLQHEADHLDGVLFIDRLEPKERFAFMDEHRADLSQMQRDAKAALRRADGTPARASERT